MAFWCWDEWEDAMHDGLPRPRRKAAASRAKVRAPEITVDEWVDGERRYRIVQHNGEMRLKANELDAEDHSCFVDLMRRVRQLRHGRRVP